MKEFEVKIECICKKYDLPVFQNIRDNVMSIIESAEPSGNEKLEAFDIYDAWLYEAFKNEEN